MNIQKKWYQRKDFWVQQLFICIVAFIWLKTFPYPKGYGFLDWQYWVSILVGALIIAMIVFTARLIWRLAQKARK